MRIIIGLLTVVLLGATAAFIGYNLKTKSEIDRYELLARLPELGDDFDYSQIDVTGKYIEPGHLKRIVGVGLDNYVEDQNYYYSKTDIVRIAAEENLDIKYDEMVARSINLYKENPDYAGWLILPGADVDYPVMKKDNPYDYYLYRDFDGNQAVMGSLFLGQGVDGNSDYTIIHGHDMRNGKMFGSLGKYTDYETYKKNPMFAFINRSEVFLYEIVGIVYTNIPAKESTDFKYYEYMGNQSTTRKKEFIDWIDDNSLFELDDCAEVYDELMILSTCSYQTENGRFLVIGKRIN